ncbi:DUF4190 domain-containing protein [Demequina pelophila]|uniref:DUF4190 domain-containing protein n=1 Tax=Demequina pelophila TaxID=1638984 RepID=UPI0007807ED5|nr:DUF4190 domain-containing protein [Demequina pelophila]
MTTAPENEPAPQGAAPPPQAGPPPQYAAPQHHAYQPYPQQVPPPVPPRDPRTEKNWMGTLSLVLSLLGLFTWFTAIAGIVLGHLSQSAAKRGEADNQGMGLAGLIVGYVIVGIGMLLLVAVVALTLGFAGWAIGECAGSNPADWCTGD